MNLNLTARGKIILSLILIVVVLAVCTAGYFAWQKHAETEAKLQQATALTQQQAENVNYLQNALGESKQNAEMLAIAVKQAQTGQIQPVVHFTVQAPTLPVAAEQVVDRINSNDKTLPPAALEKTDRTVVVSNENKTPQANYDVGVFKVNNYRNWEWSAGYGVQNGSKYVPIGLQRNYSKDKAIEAEIHLDASNVEKVNGWEIKQVWKTDKLFLLF
jgi:hypothetical protein